MTKRFESIERHLERLWLRLKIIGAFFSSIHNVGRCFVQYLPLSLDNRDRVRSDRKNRLNRDETRPMKNDESMILSSISFISCKCRQTLHQLRSFISSLSAFDKFGLFSLCRCPGYLAIVNRCPIFQAMDLLSLLLHPLLQVEPMNLHPVQNLHPVMNRSTNSIQLPSNVQQKRPKNSNVRVGFLFDLSKTLFDRSSVPLEYASQAFDVVRMQEQTKQLELQKQMKVRDREENRIDLQWITLGSEST